MRPAEAMSRPLNCVLTSRRTLGTPMSTLRIADAGRGCHVAGAGGRRRRAPWHRLARRPTSAARVVTPPRGAGWWRTGLPNSAQQDADLDPTARAARWHGLVGQVVVGCPVGLPNRVVTCDNTPRLVPPR